MSSVFGSGSLSIWWSAPVVLLDSGMVGYSRRIWCFEVGIVVEGLRRRSSSSTTSSEDDSAGNWRTRGRSRPTRHRDSILSIPADCFIGSKSSTVCDDAPPIQGLVVGSLYLRWRYNGNGDQQGTLWRGATRSRGQIIFCPFSQSFVQSFLSLVFLDVSCDFYMFVCCILYG